MRTASSWLCAAANAAVVMVAITSAAETAKGVAYELSSSSSSSSQLSPSSSEAAAPSGKSSFGYSYSAAVKSAEEALEELHLQNLSADKEAEKEGGEAFEEDENDKNRSFDGSELVAWIRDGGGYIHPHARIGLDPTGNYRGVFASDGTIRKGELLSKIPWNLIIGPKEYDPNVIWNCDAIHELHRQFSLGDQSPYAPYVKYLLDQPRGRIPNEWTSAGRDLLSEVLGVHQNPRNFESTYDRFWIEGCDGPDTDLGRAAYYQFTSRDEDTLMVPFYDMHNHSNDPKKLNTIYTAPRRAGESFTMRATRDITDGEQIMISYNRCNPCWFDKRYKDCNTFSPYGTEDVFEVFGFVEDYPQMWSVRARIPINIDGEGEEDEDEDEERGGNGPGAYFCLDRNDRGGGEATAAPSYSVRFGDNYSELRGRDYYEGEVLPDEDDMEFLADELERLRDLDMEEEEEDALDRGSDDDDGDSDDGESDADDDDSGDVAGIPTRYEWDTARRYRDALITAISAAIIAAEAETVGRAVRGRGGRGGALDEL